MSKLSQLKQKIQEANRSILELKFGCEVFVEIKTDLKGKWAEKGMVLAIHNYDFEVLFKGADAGEGASHRDSVIKLITRMDIKNAHYGENRKYRILGRSIHLADIFIAIKKNVEELAPENLNWLLDNYNLTSDSLDNQSEEMISFLHKLIFK